MADRRPHILFDAKVTHLGVVADRRHGPRLRSQEWRDPAVLAKLPEHVRGLALQVADAFDDIERREL